MGKLLNTTDFIDRNFVIQVGVLHAIVITPLHTAFSLASYLPYSGKIWQALNLAISAKTPYFLIWQILNLLIGPQVKILYSHHDVEPNCLMATCHL